MYYTRNKEERRLKSRDYRQQNLAGTRREEKGGGGEKWEEK
jgi:hypothetical protein